MDVVISKLNEIRDNQYYLYESIQQAKSVLNQVLSTNEKMVQQLDTIQENTALTEYNTRCTSYTTSAIADMMVIRELLHS